MESSTKLHPKGDSCKNGVVAVSGFLTAKHRSPEKESMYISDIFTEQRLLEAVTYIPHSVSCEVTGSDEKVILLTCVARVQVLIKQWLFR
jgi:hypothetical protein